jgi:hypothetical protein
MELKLAIKLISYKLKILFRYMYVLIQGISRVIMSPAELKMQPTIHFQSERAYFNIVLFKTKLRIDDSFASNNFICHN